MTRRAMTKARRDRIVLNHFIRRYGWPPCEICGTPLILSEPWVAEHMTPFALGGKDDDGEEVDGDSGNVRPACPECAMRKTAGTAATGHRGDTSAIRRADRLAKGGKKRGPGPKGRGFDTTFKRKLNGRTERREEV